MSMRGCCYKNGNTFECERLSGHKQIPHRNYMCIKRYYRRPDGTDHTTYGIVEVFYDEDGELEFVKEDFVAPDGDTIDELKDTLNRMIACIDKESILDERSLLTNKNKTIEDYKNAKTLKEVFEKID